MAQHPAKRSGEVFQSWGGRITGFIGIGVVAIGAVLTVLDYHSGEWRALVACALGAVLLWAILVRPTVVLHEDRLVLRGIVTDTSLPLAAIDSVVIRQFLVVRAAGRRFTSAGLGRRRRDLRGDKPLPTRLGFGQLAKDVDTPKVPSYEDLAQGRLDQAVADAHLLADASTDLSVRRTPVWSVVVPATILGVALAIGFLL